MADTNKQLIEECHRIINDGGTRINLIFRLWAKKPCGLGNRRLVMKVEKDGIHYRIYSFNVNKVLNYALEFEKQCIDLLNELERNK
jgi:hypothetical protein